MNALRVVRGAPSEAELAAVVASITALQSAAEAHQDTSHRQAGRPSAWSNRARLTRGAVGPRYAGGWHLAGR
ncbi:MAG: acyl-CoA carboxylase subunit epsilon [Buchananella hordeovulneris]|nr:acyl-CoA carboxylase subunit epsilon [Buchananella hordeovulneris]